MTRERVRQLLHEQGADYAKMAPLDHQKRLEFVKKHFPEGTDYSVMKKGSTLMFHVEPFHIATFPERL